MSPVVKIFVALSKDLCTMRQNQFVPIPPEALP
jgi:hypothetical protein